MSEENTDTAKAIAGVALLAALPFHALIEGFVTMKLWLWFIVPLGAPTLGLAHAAGISLFVDFLTAKVKPKNQEPPTLGAQLGHIFLLPPVFLFVAWLIRSFV